jgi:hypothetical protein
LPQNLPQYVQDVALSALTLPALSDHTIHGAALPAAEQVAQHVLQIATARTTLSAWGSTLTAAAQNVAQQILQAAAARLVGRRCGRPIVIIVDRPAAARHRWPIVIGGSAVLRRRWLPISRLTALAGQLTEQVSEDVCPLSWT